MSISAINFGCGRPQFGNGPSVQTAAETADRLFTSGRSAQAISTLETALGRVKPEDRDAAQAAARQLNGYYEIYGQDAEARELAEKFGL